MFCACDSAAPAKAEMPAEAEPCAHHMDCPGLLPEHSDRKAPDDRAPQKDKPCSVGVMLSATLLAPAFTFAPQVADNYVPASLDLWQEYTPQAMDESPIENQPPPVSLLVVRTHFLRI